MILIIFKRIVSSWAAFIIDFMLLLLFVGEGRRTSGPWTIVNVRHEPLDALKSHELWRSPEWEYLFFSKDRLLQWTRALHRWLNQTSKWTNIIKYPANTINNLHITQIQFFIDKSVVILSFHQNRGYGQVTIFYSHGSIGQIQIERVVL